MEYDKWVRTFRDIKQDFPELDFSLDREARDLLYGMVDEFAARSARDMVRYHVRDKDVTIVGAAGVEESELDVGGTLIACDGACVNLNELGVRAEVAVTDLDSPVNEIWNCLKPEGVAVVHGHGDNLDILGSELPDLMSETAVLPTTQVEEKGHVGNFGGFTDGDRAVFLALHFKPRSIRLVGYDFSSPGEYSFHNEAEIKKRKLEWANRLVDMAKLEARTRGIQFKMG